MGHGWVFRWPVLLGRQLNQPKGGQDDGADDNNAHEQQNAEYAQDDGDKPWFAGVVGAELFGDKLDLFATHNEIPADGHADANKVGADVVGDGKGDADGDNDAVGDEKHEVGVALFIVTKGTGVEHV